MTKQLLSVKTAKRLLTHIDKVLEDQAKKLATLGMEYGKAAAHFSALHCKGVKKVNKNLMTTAKHIEKLAKEFT